MLSSLQEYTQREAQGLLSAITLSLLPSPTSQRIASADSDVRRRVLTEARNLLHLRDDDESPATRTKMLDFLGDQISESVLRGADLREIEARLSGIGVGLTGEVTNLIGILTHAGVPKEHAESYAEGVRRGGTLVIVNAPDNQAEGAVEILNRHGAVDVEERGPLYRDDDEQGFQIIEEDLTVGKRQIQRGGTRVQTYVIEHPVEESVTLHEEHVIIERRLMERDGMVSKEARVVEEVVVGKTATARVEAVSDTVRRADVGAEELPNVTSVTGTAKP